MAKPIHVKYNNGTWQIIWTSTRGKRTTKTIDTQSEAIRIAKEYAIKRKTELIVYRRDGSIRSKDTFGPDPFPPRA